MHNRTIRVWAVVLASALLPPLWCGPALAGALDALTSKDASSGLRAALGQGIDTAVAHLGVPGGFLQNPKVAIPLPPALEKVEKGLRMVGMGGDADELKAAMNHAAESAMADAKPVLKQALQLSLIHI